MNRRVFLVGIASCLACASILSACGLIGRTETTTPNRQPTIGFLVPGSQSAFASRVDAFRAGLAELGYVDGQNITVEYRYVEGGPDEFLGPATELVQRNVDVLVTAGGGVRAAVRATSSIPIVFAAVTDPVGTVGSPGTELEFAL